MLLNEVSIRDGDLLPRRTRLRYPHNINGCCCCKSSCYRCRCSCECCCCRCGRSPGSCNLSAPKFYNSPAAAVPADAQHCHSEFLAAAAAPVAADITADPAWLHRLRQCRFPLHLLMLRIDVTTRGGELLARTRRPCCYCYRCWCWCCRLYAACIGCCCCCRCCWSRLFCNLSSPKFQHSLAACP